MLVDAYDDDGSGFITAKEFGQFMKRGAPASVRMSNLEARRMLGTRMRASLEQEKAERIEEQLRAADRKQTAHRKEMAELKAELQQLNSVHAVSDAQVFIARLKGMKKQKTEASLAAAQVLITKHLAALKALDGVKEVKRVVCGGCLDFKVITALDAEKFGAWEGAAFAPEAEFLEEAAKIEGISTVETQTYTFMSL